MSALPLAGIADKAARLRRLLALAEGRAGTVPESTVMLPLRVVGHGALQRKSRGMVRDRLGRRRLCDPIQSKAC